MVGSDQLQVIKNNSWQVGILPHAGGSIAYGRIKRNGQWVDFMRPTSESSYNDPSACASYILSPWSNRIRDGHFRFRGKDYQLRVNYYDGTAIHGTAKEFPWKIDSADDSHITLSFDARQYSGVNFPFQFSTRQGFSLKGNRFSVETWIKNEDKSAMPAGFGHHPYFQRTLGSDEAQVEIPVTQYFVLENCLPSAGPVPLEPRIDFRQLRPLGTEFIDDALTGRIDEKPIRFVYGSTEIAMHFDPVYQNVVFYLPQGKTYFALEPVTNANDGFNLYDQGIAGNGVFILEPGQEKQGTFSLEIVK